MKSIYQFLQNSILWVAKILTLFLAISIFATAFLTTGYSPDMTTRINHFAWDNVLLSLLCLVIFLGILFLFTKLSRLGDSFVDRLLWVVLFFYGIGGCILVLFSKSGPSGDPAAVYNIAVQFSNNYYVAVMPGESYLSYYPHQIGLVAYYDVLLRIWNLFKIDMVGYHFIKVINIGWGLLIIYSLYQSIKLLFHKTEVQFAYLFLIILNAPLLIYSSFVYGEIPSIGALSLGLWCIIKIFTNQTSSKKEFVLIAILSILCIAGGISFRKNTLVILIAICITTFLTALFEKRYWLLLLPLFYALVGISIIPLIQMYYEYRGGNILNDGVPALTFLAMGMQGDGWYNGFNFLTYQQSGLNKELSNTIALEAIRERLAYFKENLGECFLFYLKKFQSQWCDGTYGSMQATQADAGGRSPFFIKLYFGSYHYVYIFLCNIFQNLLYLGNMIFAFACIKGKYKNAPIIYYLCPVAVFGAFLFHTIWEANSRYIFHSSLLLLPTASLGLILLVEWFSQKATKKAKHSSEDINNEVEQ